MKTLLKDINNISLSTIYAVIYTLLLIVKGISGINRTFIDRFSLSLPGPLLMACSIKLNAPHPSFVGLERAVMMRS